MRTVCGSEDLLVVVCVIPGFRNTGGLASSGAVLSFGGADRGGRNEGRGKKDGERDGGGGELHVRSRS